MARKGLISASETVDGKRVWGYGKTKEEAYADLKVKIALQKAGVNKPVSNMLVKDWCYEWLDTYKSNIEGSTWHKEIQAAIKLRIIPSIGSMQVRNVKPLHIAKMYNAYTDMSESAGKKLVQITRAIFDMAEENDLTDKSPARNVKAPKFKKKEGYRAITDEERRLTITTAQKHPKEGLPFLIMLCCGLRPGEVSALKMKDYDPESKTLSVSRARKSTGEVGEPKSQAGIRMVPVPKLLSDELGKLHKDPEDFVVTSVQGRMLTKTSLKRTWYKFKDLMDIESGIPEVKGHPIRSDIAEDLQPYCYRHTYATDLQAAGVSINVAKELLGHSDIRMTGNIYTHKSDTAFEAARDKLEVYHSCTTASADNDGH